MVSNYLNIGDYQLGRYSMSRKGAIEMNKHRYALCQKYAAKRTELKQRIYDKSISIAERMKLYYELQKLPRNSSPTRYRNRCSITGRPRGYFRFFGMSRISVRNASRIGIIPGVRQSSW